MASHLLIVESPSKAKTLKKYLGKDFEILASYGHVRDLVPKTGAVDPDDHFRMKYEIIDRNAKHVRCDRQGRQETPTPSFSRPTRTRGRGHRLAPFRDPEAKRALRTRRSSGWCSTRSPRAP